MALWSNLTPEQKSDLWRWRKAVEGQEVGPVGLWVCGDRFAGSSYIASIAYGRMTTDHPEWVPQYHNARVLMEGIREYWQLAQDPHRPESDELTQDYYALDDEIDRLWNKAGLVWLDDLHDNLDMRFWLRHVQPDLERRVKSGKATIVATNCTPNHPEFQTIQRVIEGLFVVVQADHARR